MRHVLNHLVESLNRNETIILGAIVRSSGSAPRTSGARMLVKSNGTLVGTVGGGALEGKCQARAKELLRSPDHFAMLDFDLSATVAAEAGMVCGGTVSVLLTKVEPQSLPLYKRLSDAYDNSKRALLVTALPQGDSPPKTSGLGIESDDDLPIGLREEILKKNRRAPFLLNFENQEYFIEPLIHPATVHLVGAGHVALATATCANFAGFEIVVMDDRAEFANVVRYPQARDVYVLSSFNNCLKELGPDDYVVIVTRGHLHDLEVLVQALKTDAGYIGMIGSRKKRAAIYEAVRNEGFTDIDLQRVHSPIGISIGADTPEEIAVSIVAELVQTRAGIGQ
jgi:xanthine dehydrogenase accessory factor